MVSTGDSAVLRRNVAVWDRVARASVAVALLAVCGALLHNRFALLAAGLIAGLQVQVAATGY